ncbi:MAG: o-succinylbenzoate synthase [Isosphaeraceae bacterium]
MSATDPIERIVLTHIQVPFKEPFRTSTGEVAIRDAIVVEISTSSAVGLGEATPMPAGPGGHGGAAERCWDDLTRLIAPDLLGQTLGDVDDIAALADAWKASGCSTAGAETALWDLLGQARHASIAELLGATDLRIDQGVEAGLTVGLPSSIVELIQSIEAHLEAGYRRVKLKIGPGQDVELVRAVRQHCGDIPLAVDAEGAYSWENVDVFRELDRHDLLMIEQPLPADDLDGLAALQREINTPICLDETASGPEAVAEAIPRGAGRIVNLKLQRVGGLGPARAIHDLCYSAGVACYVGSIPELGIGRAHAIHLATLPNCKYPSDVVPSSRWFVDDYSSPLIELAGPGIIEVPTRPGLGFHLDAAKVKRYQVRQQEFTNRTAG